MAWPPSMPSSEAMRPAVTRVLDVVGRERERKRIRVALDHPQRDVDLLELGAREAALADVGRARDVHRPELAADAARAQARDVGVAGGVLPEVEGRRRRAAARRSRGSRSAGRCGRRSAGGAQDRARLRRLPRLRRGRHWPRAAAKTATKSAQSAAARRLHAAMWDRCIESSSSCRTLSPCGDSARVVVAPGRASLTALPSVSSIP